MNKFSLSYVPSYSWTRAKESELHALLITIATKERNKAEFHSLQYEINELRSWRKSRRVEFTLARKFYRALKVEVSADSSQKHGMLSSDSRTLLVNNLRYALRRRRSNLKSYEHAYHNFKGVEFATTGLVHTKSREILTIATKYKKAYVFIDKAPKSLVNHIGVEIEFFATSDSDYISDTIVELGLSEHVCLKEDGSLHWDSEASTNCDYCEGSCCEESGNPGCVCDCTCSESDNNPDGYIGHELCILAPQPKFASILKQVTHMLSSIDAEVNTTCGLHVHLDMRSRRATKAFRNLVLAQRLLFSMIPKSRRNNNYCAPVSTIDHKIVEDRYWAINPAALKRHTTIEVRLHSGTTNFTKIMNWVQLLIRIADAPEFKSQIKTLSDLQKKTKLPVTLKKYILARIKEFGGYTDVLKNERDRYNSDLTIEESLDAQAA